MHSTEPPESPEKASESGKQDTGEAAERSILHSTTMRLLLYKRNVLLLVCAAYHAVQAFVPVSLRMGTTGAPTNPPASAIKHMISASPAAVNSSGCRGMTRADAARAVGATIAGTLALKVKSCAAAVRSKEDLVSLVYPAPNMSRDHVQLVCAYIWQLKLSYRTPRKLG